MTALTPEEFSQAIELLEPEWPIAVAVSGGADSMALLRLTDQWSEGRGKKNSVVALSVDHGLRPESADEVAQVRQWCTEMSIPHHILKWQGVKPSSNLQALARQARYELLAEWCKAANIKSLLVAHHLDDQAETFLLRLIRGSGVDGLSGMAPSKPMDEAPEVRLLRPLLSFPRNRVRETLTSFGQEWIEDPSNQDSKYARIQVRQLRDYLLDLGLEPRRIVDTAARLRTARQALEFYADSAFSKCVNGFPIGFTAVNVDGLRQEPRDIGLRVLARCLGLVSGNPYRPRSEKLGRIYDLIINDDLGGGCTLHGCQVVGHEGKILFLREERSTAGSLTTIDLKNNVRVWDQRFRIEVAEADLAKVPDDLTIQALGEKGLKEIKAFGLEMKKKDRPRLAVLTLPSIWQGSNLRSVPSLGLNFSRSGVPTGDDFGIYFKWLGTKC